jgi:hypothetical protein
MPPTPTIREACFNDHSRISALEARYGLVPKSYEEWKHLWIANPIYQRVGYWPIGWVLEHQDQIVGYLGNIPLSYEYGQKQIIAAASHGLVVDSAYRSYSLSLIGKYYRQPNISLFLSTTANAQASKAYEFFRAERVPAGNWNESAFWVTGYQGFMECLLHRKRIPMASGLSVPLGIAMFMKDRVAGANRRDRLDGLAINNYSHFDDRFETFWQTLKSTGCHRLLATRSREMLEWHFRYMLSRGASVVTVENDSRLIAYAIFCRQDNPVLALKRLQLVDFQSLNGDTELLVPMLTWALKQCRLNGVHMLEVCGFAHEKKALLESLAPHRRALPSWLYFYKAADKDLANDLRNPEVWDPCCFDGDSSL